MGERDRQMEADGKKGIQMEARMGDTDGLIGGWGKG